MKKTVIFVLLVAVLAMLAIPTFAAEPNEPIVYDFTTFEESDPTDEASIDLQTDDFHKMIIRTFPENNTKYLQITTDNCIDNNTGYVAYTVNAPAGEEFTAMDLSIDFNRLANYAGGNSSTDFSVYVKADDGEYQKAYTVNVKNGDAVITNIPVDVTELVKGAAKVTVKLEIHLNAPVGYDHDWTQISKLTINNSSAVPAADPGPGDGSTSTPSETGDPIGFAVIALLASVTGTITLTRKKNSK